MFFLIFGIIQILVGGFCMAVFVESMGKTQKLKVLFLLPLGMFELCMGMVYLLYSLLST